MKVAALILMMFLAAVSVAGQVTGAKDDISQEKYLAAEKKAADWLRTQNYRSTSSKAEYEKLGSSGKLLERTLKEVVQPNKWRTVEETYGANTNFFETIDDGRDRFVRANGGPWRKNEIGCNSDEDGKSGQVTNLYRHLPEVKLSNEATEFYEHISVRTVNQYSHPINTVTRYIRTIRAWYSVSGRILRRTEENSVESREGMTLEVTTYEYNPKDLKIEAPIK